MKNHKIEFEQSEGWDLYYRIKIDGKVYGSIVLNEKIECMVDTNIYLHGKQDTLHNMIIRQEFKDVKAFFRLAKSFISFCLNNNMVDLSKPYE